MMYIVLEEDRFPLRLLLVGKMYFWEILLKERIKYISPKSDLKYGVP